jgi:hypothetical protein
LLKRKHVMFFDVSLLCVSRSASVPVFVHTDSEHRAAVGSDERMRRVSTRGERREVGGANGRRELAVLVDYGPQHARGRFLDLVRGGVVALHVSTALCTKDDAARSRRYPVSRMADITVSMTVCAGTFSMMERTDLKRPAFLRIQSPVMIHVCMQLKH